ncbi:MAG TPA: isocitrate lyase/phosphoenolpyruvate mutase family protein [Roseiarcus sp.]|nr:isocitrate lyase/phosphoenolpyruvate mutase family protein [Roseiarcus sp.]
MPKTAAEKRAAFRELHRAGCFVLPNPWDVGSARLFERHGFQALASTSSGYAWTTGRPDFGVSRADVLAHLAALCAAVDLPINADYESGFAADAEGVAESVRLAIEAGVAGLSIEDRGPDGLYDKATALERLAAARRAIKAAGGDTLLVARAEILLSDPTQVSAAIDKLVAFAPLADCLYAPGVRKPDDIRAMVAAVAPKPLNVLAMDPSVPVQAYADLGVRRISVGGGLARVGWGAVAAAADQIRQGSFAGLASGLPNKELNAIFAP